jgi:uncharacterized Zn finger protein (UPF0148 family)
MRADGADSEDAPPVERVVYRDADEFNKAMDAAAESIANAKGPDVLGHVVWWGIIALQAGLYIAYWAFGWDVRRTLIPGVDLVKPLWIVIVSLVVWYHVWTRGQHGRILRNRLCLKCGTSLLDVELDDEDGGVCPTCERRFNLGAYQRPSENRGRDFRGYVDATHFDKTLYATAEHIKKARRLGFESDLMRWLWLGLGVCFGGQVLLRWDPFDWIPGGLPITGIWFVALLVWGAWYAARVRRIGPSIVEHRLCMGCGYCLLHTPTDEDGTGRCPECGSVFVLAQYERPLEEEEDEEET